MKTKKSICLMVLFLLFSVILCSADGFTFGLSHSLSDTVLEINDYGVLCKYTKNNISIESGLAIGYNIIADYSNYSENIGSSIIIWTIPSISIEYQIYKFGSFDFNIINKNDFLFKTYQEETDITRIEEIVLGVDKSISNYTGLEFGIGIAKNINIKLGLTLCLARYSIINNSFEYFKNSMLSFKLIF